MFIWTGVYEVSRFLSKNWRFNKSASLVFVQETLLIVQNQFNFYLIFSVNTAHEVILFVPVDIHTDPEEHFLF